MREIRMILIMAVTVLLSSCSDDIANLSEGMERQGPAGTSLDRGLTRAEALLGKIEGRTRGTKRLVESVSYVSTHRGTRSAECDSLYYLVNYADNQGFAVLGATEDNEGVYAISGEGHLEMEDTLDNPGLAIFFDMLPNGGVASRPTIGTDTLHQIDRPDPFLTEDLSSEVKPLLSINVRKWHQYYPFSKECVIKGKQCVVGCVPLALGMLMSFYEWPKSYLGVEYNWKQMKSALPSYESHVVAAKIPVFLRELGSQANLKTSYGVVSSSTEDNNRYKDTFEHFGYTRPGDFQSFTTHGLYSFLRDNEKPVLMKGRKVSGGHMWVVDGYYYDWHWSNAVVGDNYYGEGCMFHVVWGWGGDCNGYFKIGDGFIPTTQYNESGDSHNYTDKMMDMVQYHKLQFVGDVEPIK